MNLHKNNVNNNIFCSDRMQYGRGMDVQMTQLDTSYKDRWRVITDWLIN